MATVLAPSDVSQRVTEDKFYEVPPEELLPEPPDISNIVTEDDTPVDNLPSEKQQRLLVEPLYSTWTRDQLFLAAANVGIFSAVNRPALVPDVFLSLDVQIAEDWWERAHRTYFMWEFGKPPDVVIEIVSNKRGQELSKKLPQYARIGVPYYVIYDPQRLIQAETLVVYELVVGEYVRKQDNRLEKVGLELALWEGMFEGKYDQWLRWHNFEGQLILTGAERAEQEHQRAEQEHQRAEQEHQRAERLMTQLRALGIEPEA
jgi:Uma2 family endonuclease